MIIVKRRLTKLFIGVVLNRTGWCKIRCLVDGRMVVGASVHSTKLLYTAGQGMCIFDICTVNIAAATGEKSFFPLKNRRAEPLSVTETTDIAFHRQPAQRRPLVRSSRSSVVRRCHCCALYSIFFLPFRQTSNSTCHRWHQVTTITITFIYITLNHITPSSHPIQQFVPFWNRMCFAYYPVFPPRDTAMTLSRQYYGLFSNSSEESLIVRCTRNTVLFV